MTDFISKIQYNAPVTLTFFFIVFMVFIINKATRDKANQKLFSVYASSPLSPLFYIRLLGHVLGHVSFSHMINNMMLFLILSPTMEEKYGAKTLLICFVITAIVTGILQCLLFRTQPFVWSVGHCIYVNHAVQCIRCKKWIHPAHITFRWTDVCCKTVL